MKFHVDEFYPTPQSLMDIIFSKVRWSFVDSVLEPSAGAGNMAEYVRGKMKASNRSRNNLDIDCIERDYELQSVLREKNFRVIHDDFLTFQTFKRYDLIAMNPPFSNGASHLLKALEIQKDGGAIICILNAQTLRNAYTNERRTLVKKLTDIGAEIEYKQNEFICAERPTSVEIAVVKVMIPQKKRESFFFEMMKRTSYSESEDPFITDLTMEDQKKAMVSFCDVELAAGIELIEEYIAMKPYILNDLNPNHAYTKEILTLSLGNHELSVNEYVRQVRKKYWDSLFRNPKFTRKMTSNLLNKYLEQVDELKEYDFSLYNINFIQEDINRKLIKGIEECIVELFDKLSRQYAYSDELNNNIHYYNGWKTNKAWYINKKVIIPYMHAYSEYSGRFEPSYRVGAQLADIEKALNYLDGGLTESIDLYHMLDFAEETNMTKKIPLKYFYVTFYKKGTCHLEFRNDDLLKKLNIFGSQQKRWLPPGYGKKKYKDMEPEEKEVVDDFEGEEGYGRTLAKAEYFIYTPQKSLKMLESGM